MATMVTRVGKDVIFLRVRSDGRVTTASSRFDVEPTVAFEPPAVALMWTLAMVKWAQWAE